MSKENSTFLERLGRKAVTGTAVVASLANPGASVVSKVATGGALATGTAIVLTTGDAKGQNIIKQYTDRYPTGPSLNPNTKKMMPKEEAQAEYLFRVGTDALAAGRPDIMGAVLQKALEVNGNDTGALAKVLNWSFDEGGKDGAVIGGVPKGANGRAENITILDRMAITGRRQAAVAIAKMLLDKGAKPTHVTGSILKTQHRETAYALESEKIVSAGSRSSALNSLGNELNQVDAFINMCSRTGSKAFLDSVKPDAQQQANAPREKTPFQLAEEKSNEDRKAATERRLKRYLKTAEEAAKQGKQR